MANEEREPEDVIGLETTWYYAIPEGKHYGFSIAKKKHENTNKT